MGLRPGPRQQAGREVTPLGDPGGETAKSRARHGSLKGWGAAPECGSVVGSVMMVVVLCCCSDVVADGVIRCMWWSNRAAGGVVLVNRWTVELVGEVCVVVFNWRQWQQLLK